jgi:hypothetical protein
VVIAAEHSTRGTWGLACIASADRSGRVRARGAATPGGNPLKPIAAAAKRAGRAIGGVAGGFVESAAAPTIRNAEASGRRLIVDVEGSLGRQIDHAGGVASKLVGEVDKSLGDKLEKVDRSLEARIVQVNVTADEIVDRAFGRLDQSIGRIDAADVAVEIPRPADAADASVIVADNGPALSSS